MEIPLKASSALVPSPKIRNVESFVNFLHQNPSVKYLRLQWLDHTSTLRARVIPIRLALQMFQNQSSIGISKAALGLIQYDQIAPGFSPAGEYELVPCFEGLRLGERDGYATVQGEFRERDGSEVPACPRTALRRIVERATMHGLSFLVGFEVEVVFLTTTQNSSPFTHAHSWSNVCALRSPQVMSAIEDMLAAFERSKIELLQFHPESAPGQYEFVTGPLPPLESVDTLIATRDIIYAVAEKHRMRATFIPKPYPMACGTGAHIHMSMTPGENYQSFYAGVLQHLRSILAFTYCNPASYDRMQDSFWCGGRYVAWGTQNRETPLRKIEGSHWELKAMDGLANPYLALAAILGAGVQGVLDKRPLTAQDCQSDPALLSVDERRQLGIHEQLPATVDEAMSSLGEDGGLKEILGNNLVETYFAVKAAELGKFMGMSDEGKRTFLLERY
jgi:glutamine synthetase